MDKKLHELTNCPKCGRIVPRHQTYGPCPGCKAKGKTCFPAGTKIQTMQGDLPIERLNRGNCVIAVDRNGEAVVRRVKRCRHYSAQPISVVNFDDGSSLRVTDHHTVKTCRGWVMVRKLSSGDRLVEAPTVGDESSRKIVQIERAVTIEPVYNLIIEGDCTFIADGIVAHSFTRLRVIRSAIERLRFAAISMLGSITSLQLAESSRMNQHLSLMRRVEFSSSISAIWLTIFGPYCSALVTQKKGLVKRHSKSLRKVETQNARPVEIVSLPV